MLDSKSDSVHSTKTSPPELSSSSNVKDQCFPSYVMLFLGIKRGQLAVAVQAELKQGDLLTPNTSVDLQP